jgi:hypothetical protein
MTGTEAPCRSICFVNPNGKMKKALTASGLANLVLVLTVLWLGKKVNFVSRTQSESTPGPTNRAATASAQGRNQVAPAPFSWSRIESTDYHEYINNLRAIGCPEQTIRDIVKADLASLYAKRRVELEKQARGSNTAGGLHAGIEKLESEEASVLLALLGSDPSSSPTASPPEPGRFARQQRRNPSLPMALQDVPEGLLKLTPRQAAAVEDVRQRFEQQVSGLAPSDPGYASVWEKAQTESDSLLQAMLGGERYIDYQLAARQARASRGQ